MSEQKVTVSEREFRMNAGLGSYSDQLSEKCAKVAEQEGSIAFLKNKLEAERREVQRLHWIAEFYGSELEKHGDVPEVPEKPTERKEVIDFPEEPSDE